ncbi:MAG: hypothetical protein KC478_07935, partial [Bacteriovoracaceae bacterium]|nr:hypothetical protein [Bacteriovoracaceae bacterium]
NIINSGDDINFTLQATAVTGDGTLIPSIAASAVQTTLGANNSISTATDNSVTFNTIITVTINQAGAQADPTSSLPISFDVVFEEAINAATFTTADITQNGTATGLTWSIVNSGDDTNFTLQATAITVDGTVVPSIALNLVQTSYGANNSASTATDNSVSYVPPFSVTVNQKGAQADPTSSYNVEFDVVFSVAINAATFTTADITQNGTASVVTWNIINSGDDTNFTLQATNVSVQTNGTIVPSIAADLVQTSGGSNNLISTSTDNSVQFNFATVLAWSVTSYDFGTPGANVSQRFTVTNIGSVTSGTMAITRSSGNGAKWSILNDFCTSTLVPTESCTVDVEYKGAGNPSGNHAATFQASDGIVNAIPDLSCTGVTP